MSGYQITQALRTDKLDAGMGVNAYSAQFLYPDFATCPPAGPSSEANGIPNNEFQYAAYNRLCDQSGYNYAYDLETNLRPEVVGTGLRAGATIGGQILQARGASTSALYGSATPNMAQSQGLSGVVLARPATVSDSNDKLQSYISSMLGGRNNTPVVVRKS